MNASSNSNLAASEKINFFNLLIILLSIYVLGALAASTFLKIPDETNKMLNYIDNSICVIFLIDFIIRFKNAENKLKFMKWAWIDLISSIPTFNFMRIGRLFRLIRLIRVLRAFRSIRHIIHHLFKSKISGTLTSVSIIALLTLLFSSIAILQFETAPNSNIKTAEDAIWWAYVTITTVGYGDKYPVTTEGRVLAAILMTVGVGMFGTFTAFVSSWFVTQNKLHKKNTEH
ncbi:MAG: ion transporter [Bacteroidetes bacterium]|nr:ion transporter [Bacteroidota bacterium]